MSWIIGFLIILGPLVIVHELGHFFFAKIFNVRADVFSVGFGPRLFGKKWGETEFRISAIPLGGYVKLFGEEPGMNLTAAEKARALQYQEAWKRFFIFLGGPLFNFIFAVLVFMAILLIGEPQVANYVGRVVEGSPAATFGFKYNDQILEIDGQPVEQFEDFFIETNDRPGEKVTVQVKRDSGKVEDLRFALPSRKGYSIYGEEKAVGMIEGLSPVPRSAEIGVSDPGSIAGKAGLKTGDIIVKLNGKDVANWEEFSISYKRLAPRSQAELVVKRGSENLTVNLSLPRQVNSPEEGLGVYSSELFIRETVPDAPAARAGIQAGDRIVKVGGEPVGSFYELKKMIQAMGEKDGKVNITWEREGKFITQVIETQVSDVPDPLLNIKKTFTVGIYPMLSLAEPKTTIVRVLNPLKLMFVSTSRVVNFTWKNMVSIAKMFSGDVSVKTLGGPILIGKIAGDSLARGIVSFLSTMAILSIGLGFLNLLPVPVLDGGHLALLGIEMVRGKPLTIRQMEIVQQVGLSLILLLMVVVIKNDISRLSFLN